MDKEFLATLEQEVSDVGQDEVWKKQIGTRLIWFAPVTTTGQGKVQEAMLADSPGVANILEAKKITLSRAIVGINKLDLRSYRKMGPVFPIVDPRVGQEALVDLPTYLLYKLADWGSDYTDVVFDVFADLMESYKKSVLATIKFENAKEPRMELAELEDRAASLREQLGLPRLMELMPEKVPESTPEPVSVSQTEDKAPVEFNPFKRVDIPPEATGDTPKVTSPVAQVTVPVPIPDAQPVMSRAAQLVAEHSSPENPFVATPSVAKEVIETPQRRSGPITPPIINPVQQNINPRFKPQR